MGGLAPPAVTNFPAARGSLDVRWHLLRYAAGRTGVRVRGPHVEGCTPHARTCL